MSILRQNLNYYLLEHIPVLLYTSDLAILKYSETLLKRHSVLHKMQDYVKSYPGGLTKSPFDRETRLTVVKS